MEIGKVPISSAFHSSYYFTIFQSLQDTMTTGHHKHFHHS